MPCKPINPLALKFIQPPKELANALHLLARIQERNVKKRSKLQEELAQAGNPRTEIELENLQKNINQISHTSTIILSHLTANQKTRPISLHHNLHTPNVSNVLKVQYGEHEFHVNLPQNYVNANFAQLPKLGTVRHSAHNSQQDQCIDLSDSEALFICNEYRKQILELKRIAKAKNEAINIHNAVLKRIKRLLNHGLVSLIEEAPAEPAPKAAKPFKEKDKEKHLGEFRMRKRVLRVA